MEGGGYTSISILRTICSFHLRQLGSCWKGHHTVCMYVALFSCLMSRDIFTWVSCLLDLPHCGTSGGPGGWGDRHNHNIRQHSKYVIFQKGQKSDVMHFSVVWINKEGIFRGIISTRGLVIKIIFI